MASPGIQFRKSLGPSLERPSWPRGVRIVTFEPSRHAPAAHRLLTAAYGHGGGTVAGFPQWWAQLRSDDEYDPRLVFLALDRKDQVAGLAQCWTSAFVKDLAVDQAWRRRGLGKALLLHVFSVFWDRGCDTVDLKVERDNPSGAERLYGALGMVPVDEG
jgi:ribosomal protein S18 acetylase RimI-like enzyme